MQTWSTGSDHDSVRNPDVASPMHPSAGPRARSRADADDTRVNQQERSGETLTPIDQGNGDADIKLTQHIRQSLMADGSLSFTAKNVKIITVNGKVTLRGAVKTDQEREAVVNRAGNIAGAGNVDDQLEVTK